MIVITQQCNQERIHVFTLCGNISFSQSAWKMLSYTTKISVTFLSIEGLNAFGFHLQIHYIAKSIGTPSNEQV